MHPARDRETPGAKENMATARIRPPSPPGEMRPANSAAPAADWHALDIADTLDRLATSPDGLSSAEAAGRLRRFGPNALPAQPGRSWIAIVFGQLNSPLIYLLFAASAASLALGDLNDAGFILLVLVINTAIGAIQEGRAEANTAALRSAIRTSARVLRDGSAIRIDGREVVPGDIVLLEAGDRVPADLRLLEAAEVQADESALTGESLPVDKAVGGKLPLPTPVADRLTMLHAGSTLRRGRCLCAVVATGAATQFGSIARALDAPALPPPLTRRLERFTRLLGVASLGIVGALVAVQLASGAGVRETFLVAVALAVSIIPEGLPVAVTVALSIATRRMARRNVIIRHLPAVEGLGSCTVVATDKTGTLTVNQLTARRVWLPDHGTVELGGEGYALSGDVRFEGRDVSGRDVSPHVQRDLDRLALAAALCNDASLDPDLGPEGRTGDTVDLAFLVLAAKAGLDYGRVRTEARRVGEVPFAAERRYAATLTHHEDIHWLHVKGAVEVLAPLCLGARPQADIIATAEAMAASGYRVLAVAGKRIEPHRAAEIGGAAHHIEAELSALTFYGLVGFIDPLRPEARDAVASCRRAGVAVKMITGDHAVTALAIARDLGIASGPEDVMTGRELAGDGKALSARIAAATVFARVEPLQKVQIVEGLKAAGHVVAMTGDGVNDVPALLRADLGVAMGRDGTDAAREAADLVLTDDNFASIVSGIEEGRAAYSNIRKVVYLLLSTGAAEVALFALALATGLPVPLMPTQLLWLNLVTNGGQDVALAFEKRNPDLLSRPPRPPGESILDRLMIRQIAISGLYTGALAYAVFAWALAAGFGEFEARNVILFLMVAFENVHVFNCRSETRSAFRIPLANNWPVVVAVIGAQLVHIAAAFIPGLRDVLQIAPISPALWALLAGLALSVLAVMEADKWLRARR